MKSKELFDLINDMAEKRFSDRFIIEEVRKRLVDDIWPPEENEPCKDITVRGGTDSPDCCQNPAGCTRIAIGAGAF